MDFDCLFIDFSHFFGLVVRMDVQYAAAHYLFEDSLPVCVPGSEFFHLIPKFPCGLISEAVDALLDLIRVQWV